ncbi:type III-A CRISPR-associated protein Csm2 [Rhodothermus profundi]|uniref:CRISPR system Cms protein Csm2 n=1 Tax=Rhodothermus profundi TaxID=633813 RepID=A0A1M6SLH9_9BACT|nr:type III-A CRISPR-associated protein Csm2 [Rhodothermus profundi]SHK45469.1 CRISPR-associated protein Csm2 [Rhodothermus profundi]
MSKFSIPDDLARCKPEEIDRIADQMGKAFKNIKTAQLRNVFAHINRMRTRWRHDQDFQKLRRDLVMLKPRLAYAAGRQREVREMSEAFRKAINAVLASKDFGEALRNFFDLIEAVVAYHKYYGDKDN